MAKTPRGQKRAKGKGAKRTPVDLTRATARARAALGKDIKAVLRRHGVTTALAAIHIEPPAPRRTARAKPATAALTAAPGAAPAPPPPPPAPGPLVCPPGQVSRVVCFFKKGTFICEQRCVPA